MRKHVVLLACLSLAVCAGAQEVHRVSAETVEAPSAVMAAAAEAGVAPAHRFFDRRNLELTAGNLFAQIADGITTQHLLSRSGQMRTVRINGTVVTMPYFYEEANPVARPFATRGWAGEASYIGMVTGTELGVRYLLHRTGHHKLERIVPLACAAVSGFAASRNAGKY